MKTSIFKYGIFLLAANHAVSSADGQVGGQEAPVMPDGDKKKNILLIISDEHPWWYSGAYGHENMITPNIDKLAENGIVFDAAYCPSPMSAPSRASMMTGRHVHIHEVWDNAAPLRSDWPTFAHSFSAAGYRTILVGKMHFIGADQKHGFSERWTQDIYPATFDWTSSNRDSIYVNLGQNIDRVFESGVGRTADFSYDDEVLFRTKYGLRYLNRLHDARPEEDRPLMMAVNFIGPHYPFVAPKKYYDMYSDSNIDLPHLPDGFIENESDHLQWAREHGRFEELVPDSIVIKARRAIKARTTMIDEYIGEIIEVLKEVGIYENTIIIYASDHGDAMGERGLWFKNTALDPSAKVPLIFSGPGIPKSRRTSEVVSLMDFGPTLTSLAGIEMIYPVTDGRDFSDLVLGKRESEEGLAIMEQYGEGAKRGYRMVRKGRYKLIYVPGGDMDLYDMEKDPGEWSDLSEKKEYQPILEELIEIVLDGWTDHELYDERRFQSEERRLSINKAPKPDWNYPSPSLPHPVPGFGKEEYWVK